METRQSGRWLALNCAVLMWGAAAAQAQSVVTNYQDGTQNIVFAGPDQHVYQIVANGSAWASADVTAAAGLPPAATGSALSCFWTGSAVGISYFGVSGHLFEAVFQGGSSWSGVDITNAAGLPAAQPGSALSTYLDGDQNWVYQGTNQHIYQAVFGGTWSGGDVTAASGQTAAAGTPITSFASNGGVVISFFGTDQHVHEAFYANGWSGLDVTQMSGAPPAQAGSALAMYVDGAQNWVYEGTDQKIYEAVYTGSWGYTNVTADSSLPLAAVGSPISAFVQGGAISISFFDANRNLWEAVFLNGQWYGGVNLTAAGNAPPAMNGSGLTSYVTSAQNWVYQAQNGLLLISFNGSWSEVNLSAASGLQWINTPAKEYIYFNGKAAVIENQAP